MESENSKIYSESEYYSDKNITEQTNKAMEFMGGVFNDNLRQIEYLKIRQIAKEIQETKTMNSEDINSRPMWTEIVSRYVFDNYGEDIGTISDLTDSDWQKTKDHLKKLRREYLDE